MITRKPSIAFKPDTERERTISRRLSRNADALAALSETLPSNTARTIARIVASIRRDSDSYHPTMLRYGSVETYRGTRIGLIDSVSSSGYRLLPCAEAKARGLTKKETVSCYRVREFPTLQMALAYVVAIDKHNARIRRAEKAHERRMKPLRLQREKTNDRYRDLVHAHQQRKAAHIEP